MQSEHPVDKELIVGNYALLNDMYQTLMYWQFIKKFGNQSSQLIGELFTEYEPLLHGTQATEAEINKNILVYKEMINARTNVILKFRKGEL